MNRCLNIKIKYLDEIKVQDKSRIVDTAERYPEPCSKNISDNPYQESRLILIILISLLTYLDENPHPDE